MSDHLELEHLPEDERVREVVELARGQRVEWDEGRQEEGWGALAEALGLEEEARKQGGRREGLWAVVAAAVVLVGGVALFQQERRTAAPTTEPVVEVKRTEQEAPRRGRDVEARDEAVADVPARELTLLAHRVDGMREPLFASADARWTYEPSGTMTLERGRVLIEYVPTASPSALSVVTEDARVLVLGTVFSVERREGSTRVAVFEGSVRVDHGDTSHTLVRDQVWSTGDDTLSATRADELEEVAHHVDMEAHRARLERVVSSETLRGARYRMRACGRASHRARG